MSSEPLPGTTIRELGLSEGRPSFGHLRGMERLVSVVQELSQMGQSVAQQDEDSYECYNRAKTQSGVDPGAPETRCHSRTSS